MNFLAHLYLAGGEEDLMVGAMLGDFVRGRTALWSYPRGIREGIRLHRRIDKVTDHTRQIKLLRGSFPKEFRRYAGIIIDLAFDYELANQWQRFSKVELRDFDLEVREVLARHDHLIKPGLRRFMDYADRRGLFEAYRHEDEMLYSLAGIGTRLKRANPLHRVPEIWPEVKADIHGVFGETFPVIQSDTEAWRKRRSTKTGS